MKLGIILPLVASAGLASSTFFPQVSAAPTLEEAYGFSTSYNDNLPYMETYALPSGLTDADLDASFGVSITGFSTPYSISPASPATVIQSIYLGTSPDDLATDVTAAGLGTTFSSSGPSHSDTESFSANGVFLGDLSSYSYVTIVTNFDLSADTLADGDGSIFLYNVPEPSTWALLLSGAGLLGFFALRRDRSALA